MILRGYGVLSYSFSHHSSAAFGSYANKSLVNSPLAYHDQPEAHTVPSFPVLVDVTATSPKPLKKKLYHIQTFRHTQSHSLSCFEVPHVCRGTPGLLIIALPADLRASILRCVSSPAGGFPKSPGPQGGKYSRGWARRRMCQIGQGRGETSSSQLWISSGLLSLQRLVTSWRPSTCTLLHRSQS